MSVEGIQAYAKCPGCNEELWTEVSNEDQACGCACGSVKIVNGTVTGEVDPAFDDAAMQAALEW